MQTVADESILELLAKVLEIQMRHYQFAGEDNEVMKIVKK